MNTKTENNLTDQQLVNKVLHGDTASFSIIIKNTEALVAQIVFKMIDHKDDREDIVQDIYLKVYHNLAGFRFQSKLSTWIAQITYNTCLNHIQKKKPVFYDAVFTRDEPEEIPGFANAEHAYPSANITEKTIDQKELARILSVATENLSPIYKTLITLYHNEEMSYEEIRIITGLPEGTVKSYLFRARKALKESILNKYKMEEL